MRSISWCPAAAENIDLDWCSGARHRREPQSATRVAGSDLEEDGAAMERGLEEHRPWSLEQMLPRTTIIVADRGGRMNWAADGANGNSKLTSVLQMERGLHFGNVSISLVLLLLLKALIGFGTSQAQGSAIGREPQSATRSAGSTSEEDGARVMERGLENIGAPVIGADVTVEDDDNGSTGEADESYGESNGNFQPTRHVTLLRKSPGSCCSKVYCITLITLLDLLLLPKRVLRRGLRHLREHLEGPVGATALLGRRARRLAPTSLLLSNSQSARLGDLSANCVGETG
ncbi:eukaryotic translation initiation factor 2-alpha kinase 3 [Lates japonicus]|uniref:Eukaryotic translation initiation factor 2-alpha kinase 3 n=1 Tax=Lates japonicus TaxID=270547 RepID=A0AAD3NI44_LATJO|nr:eukaryotic translation initiation factor 2-alpha kinase 3 [Lates japonicus]